MQRTCNTCGKKYGKYLKSDPIPEHPICVDCAWYMEAIFIEEQPRKDNFKKRGAMK